MLGLDWKIPLLGIASLAPNHVSVPRCILNNLMDSCVSYRFSAEEFHGSQLLSMLVAYSIRVDLVVCNNEQ